MKKTFEEFVKALDREEVENFGFEFTGSSCGVREYRKGNIMVAYYGGDLCNVEVNEEPIGQCDLYGFGISHDEERMLFSLISETEMTFNRFVKALETEEIENFGFEPTSNEIFGVNEYTKGNITISYCGGELSYAAIENKTIGSYNESGSFFLTEDDKNKLYALISTEVKK